MDKIEWKDSYKIGVELIDYQHKKLFELVNLFIETVNTPKCQQLIGPVLTGLVTYAKSHFAAEEAEMRKAGYPELAAHREQHEQLKQQVKAFIHRWKNSESLEQIGLLPFLKEWLTRHVLDEDKKIGIFINEQRAAAV